MKQNRILHLQVKEGKLGPSGVIDNTTVSWVPVSNITVGNWRDVQKYHKLTYESRAFDLDDLVAPSGYLLSGKAKQDAFRTIIEPTNQEPEN